MTSSEERESSLLTNGGHLHIEYSHDSVICCCLGSQTLDCSTLPLKMSTTTRKEVRWLNIDFTHFRIVFKAVYSQLGRVKSMSLEIARVAWLLRRSRWGPCGLLPCLLQ